MNRKALNRIAKRLSARRIAAKKSGKGAKAYRIKVVAQKLTELAG